MASSSTSKVFILFALVAFLGLLIPYEVAAAGPIKFTGFRGRGANIVSSEAEKVSSQMEKFSELKKQRQDRILTWLEQLDEHLEKASHTHDYFDQKCSGWDPAAYCEYLTNPLDYVKQKCSDSSTVCMFLKNLGQEVEEAPDYFEKAQVVHDYLIKQKKKAYIDKMCSVQNPPEACKNWTPTPAAP